MTSGVWTNIGTTSRLSRMTRLLLHLGRAAVAIVASWEAVLDRVKSTIVDKAVATYQAGTQAPIIADQL